MVRDSTISDVPARPRLTYAPGAIIADRYEVRQELGRGGMACVYRAMDRATGAEVALKQLLVDMDSPEHTRVIALFEREFHTLVQLRHPHVIEVYDYRLDANARPFYTMELLDGGDLRDIAPIEWRQACRMLFDVCSSLALLHSRRLLHRDITPRNIRCARDGRAKLIDFGAMAPMSDGGADVVGTPAFVAPETLHRLALDARVDLFSLGATLYYALTGYAPYAARTFADALAAWSVKVLAPSAYVEDIPAVLDDLVLSLIAVEATLRPQNAFEVMQRLAAIAGLAQSESEAVSRAYLATPMLVGREVVLDRLRDMLLTSRLSRGAGIIIEGRAGMGRTRLLDACALEATTLGFTLMRATASRAGEPFSTAKALTEHLLEALSPEERRVAPRELFANGHGDDDAEPELRNFADPSLEPESLQRAIAAFWLKASTQRPLLIAVDDVHRIDPLSASVLTAVLDKASRARVFIALSADADEPVSQARVALSSRCEAVTAQPLTLEHTQRLLESLFGAVANLEMLTHEIHAVAEGSPRECMEVAQHLVDRGLIRYSAGRWSLPQQLSAAELPRSSAATVHARAASLSATARFLAEAHALAFYETLSVRDYRALRPDLSSQAIDDALSELLAMRALVGDGASYTLANRVWSATLIAELTQEATAARHRALAAMYDGTLQYASIFHAFAGGLDDHGLKALRALQAGYAETLSAEDAMRKNVGKMMTIYPRVHAVARELGLDQRARNELRRWHLAGTTLMDVAVYPEEARRFLAQLEHDSGLGLYRADPDASDPMQRLMRALQTAQERYLATPESERVYSVEEAIRLLAEYVVMCLVIGGASFDAALIRSLPPLLEPFVALSPLLDSLRAHVLAVCDVELNDRMARARERWKIALPKLDAITGEQLKFARELATGAVFGVGVSEAELGLPSVLQCADRLEHDPSQRVAALQLRRIERLDRGDRGGAERYRLQAERLRLQSRGGARSIQTLLKVELKACAQAGDLNGIKEALDRLKPLAAAYPGWGPVLTYAEACFDFARGDFEAAQQKCEVCVRQTAFNAAGESNHAGMWFAAHATLAEALLAQNRTDDALTVTERALERWALQDDGMAAFELVRVHALAQAKLGRADAARALEAAITQQLELGVSGLRLGRSYEARAQIAIWQDDANSFEHYAALTAREYRYGAESALAASYERLIHEASRRGWREQAARIGELASQQRDYAFEPSAFGTAWSHSLTASQSAQERALSALQLLCGSRRTISGHLYLNTPHGLVLAASQGSAAPPALEDLSQMLAGTQARAEWMDDMATSMLLDDEPKAMLQVGALQYELRVLTCVIADQVKVAGVAAIEADAAPLIAMQQSSLLNRLALYLLQAAD